MNRTWLRVSKKRPCEICRRPDWCGYTHDGAACCMRVESDNPTRNGGWLHKTDDTFIQTYVPPVKKAEAKPVDVAGLWNGWSKATDFYHVDGFAMSLGVDTDALISLGCAWTGKEWAFPMRDGSGALIGIRLRSEQGKKWAVTGSRQGLFISNRESDKTAWICEGPTDTAAALSLGLYAIGRPSCLGQEEMIAECLRVKDVRCVVIVADNDEPGQRGARKLKETLRLSSCIWSPPAKDIREFVKYGGTKELIESAVRNLLWTYGKEKGRVLSPPHGSQSKPSARVSIIA